MSEVDVAFRRAVAARRQVVWRLTGAEWQRDEAHRRSRQDCPHGPTGVRCDDPAHWYRNALPEGRVFVDGKRVIEVDGRWVVQR